MSDIYELGFSKLLIRRTGSGGEFEVSGLVVGSGGASYTGSLVDPIEGTLPAAAFETGTLAGTTITTGTDTTTAGMTSAAQSADVVFWAGALYANRTSAPFRVDAAGNLTASSATIDGVNVSTQGTFGGDGSDGPLSISSGTTTINLGGQSTVVKNYTSISITGTGKLAFSNPNSSGTIIVLKSQGNVTITSSTAPCLDATGMGGAGGAGGLGASGTGNGSVGTNGRSIRDAVVHGGQGGLKSGAATTGGTALTVDNTYYYTNTVERFFERSIYIACGTGGSGGGSAQQVGEDGGAGGAGGGAVIIECNGAWNFTTSGGISVNGADGSPGTQPGVMGGAGGGGGSAGFFLCMYKTLTANSGSVTAKGGAGAVGGLVSLNTGSELTGASGGAGAGGYSGAGGAGGAGGTGAAGSAGSVGTAGAGSGGGGSAGRDDINPTLAGGAGGAASSSNSNLVFIIQNTIYA